MHWVRSPTGAPSRCSSTGRATVSRTVGYGFESCERRFRTNIRSMAKPKKTKKSETEEIEAPEAESASIAGVVETPHGYQDVLLGGSADGYSPGTAAFG